MSKQDRIERQQQQSIRATISAETFSGPLPPPEVLQRYNNAFPDAAERIMAMAERQSRHRQDIEKAVVNEGILAQRRGQFMGFVLALTAIIGGFVLIWNDKDMTGLVMVIGALGSLVATFVIGRTRQKKELDEKSKAFGPRPLVNP